MKNYLSLIKFSHTIFALPFAIIGYFLGLKHLQSAFNIKLFILVILCMVFARSSAMAFNRYADRKWDKLNQRTASREIPSGTINANAALMFVTITSVLFIITTWFINSLCFYLSPIALFIILLYSYTKRFTSWCHIVLGMGLSLAPIGAYLAITNEFNIVPILYSLTVLFWVSGFDIIYAMQDKDFDNKHKLKSIPVSFGLKTSLWISGVFHSCSVLFIIYAGILENMSIYYWIGSIIFIGLLIFQHLLVKPTDLTKVNMAFFTTNGIASVIFSIFFILDYFFK